MRNYSGSSLSDSPSFIPEGQTLCCKTMSKPPRSRASRVCSDRGLRAAPVMSGPPVPTGIIEKLLALETSGQPANVFAQLAELQWQRALIERWIDCS